MELQVLTASLEEYMPPCMGGLSRSTLCTDEFMDTHACPKSTSQFSVWVFGRASDDRSVAVRVDGVFPKLYFRIEPGETLNDLRQELESEVDVCLALKQKTFAHFYGYEPGDSASGRKLHEYVEVTYPDLRSWRRACKLRRAQMLEDVVGKIDKITVERAKLTDAMTQHRSDKMRGMPCGSGATSYTSMTANIEKMDNLLEGLEERRQALNDDEHRNHLRNGGSGGAKRPFGAKRRLRDAHEYFVDSMTRFFFEAGFSPCDWVRTPLDVVPEDERRTTCELEMRVGIGDFERLDRVTNCSYKTMYYDIETLGLDPATAPVIQVSMKFVQNDTRERHLVALGSVEDIPDATVHCCRSEDDVLRTFRRLVMMHDPDFCVSFNGVSFDNNFLAERARRLGVDEFLYMSRFGLRPARRRDMTLMFGGRETPIHYMDMTGRSNFDWYVKCVRDLTKEPQYSLNHFLTKYCGTQKDDMDYKEIPVLQRGTAADRTRLGRYCLKDSDGLDDMNVKLQLITEIIEYSRKFGVIPEYVYFRGQQLRFIALLLAKARTTECVPMIMNRPAGGFFGEGTVSYKGATVNEPVRGFYRTPVATMDWLSLYPSIMRAHNLCHSTHVIDPEYTAQEGVVEYEITEDFKVHFVNAERHKGVMPRILEELAVERKEAKKQKAHQEELARDETLGADERKRAKEMVAIYDRRQLAVKVVMNSMYGACAAMATGKYPDLAVSATTTMKGRDAMVVKKRILPERYPGIEIIYGDTDSVMVTFAQRDGGQMTVQECGRIGTEAADYVTETFASMGYGEMVLEFEKAYMPYLLLDKKRYAGLKYECDPDGDMVCKGIDCKGLETERRDKLPFVKDVMSNCLNHILIDIDEVKAMSAFRVHMRSFIDEHIPFDKFVIRKFLSSAAAAKSDTIAHARVNELRRRREPGSEVAVNEQATYVIVNGWKNEKTTHLAEDPKYAQEHGLKLNLLWYFEHTIEKTMKKLFEPFASLNMDAACDGFRKELDGKRLGLSDVLRRLASDSSGAGPSSSAPVRTHVPRPPPPRPKKRKAKP